MSDRLFFFSGLLGLGTLAMTLVLSLVGPGEIGPMAPGFNSPVLAFEFAESEAEVRALFEPAGSAAAMDRVNRWDFLYMVLYSLFLAVFALAAALETDQYTPRIAAALPLVILFADVMENVQLFRLTAQLGLDGADMTPALGRLHLFTWLKWGGLALYFVLISGYFREQPGLWRFVWVTADIPALLAIWAFFWRGQVHEYMALSIGLLFLLLVVFAWWRALTSGLQARGV